MESLPADLVAMLVRMEPDIYSTIFSLNRSFAAMRLSGACKDLTASFRFLRDKVFPATPELPYFSPAEGGRDFFDAELLREDFVEKLASCNNPQDEASCAKYALLNRTARVGGPLCNIQALLVAAPHMTWFRDENGKRAVDYAVAAGNQQLAFLLAPRTCGKNRVAVSEADLKLIEATLHKIMLGTLDRLTPAIQERLPQLAPMLAFGLDKMRMWNPIPGMYGGYGVRLVSAKAMRTLIMETKDAMQHDWRALFDETVKYGIIADSFVRICGGSERYHFVTAKGGFSCSQGYDN
jgi:hypothetical protein